MLGFRTSLLKKINKITGAKARRRKIIMEEHIKHTRLPFACGAGDASVNVRTGRMAFTHPDFETGDGDYAIAVAHVYNPEIPFPDVTPCMGNGWKLNVQQYIIPDEKDKGSDSGKFTYVDEKGYSHRFGYSYGAGRYYYTEDSDLTLQVLEGRCRNDEGSRYAITDEAGNQLYFNAYGRLISSIPARNPDAEKVFGYDGDKLTVIYDARKPSDKITLEYAEGRLVKISCEEAGGEPARVIRTLCYGYDENGSLAGIVRKTFDTEKKTKTIESAACFEYDAERDIGLSAPLHPLTKAIGGKDNSALQFDYSDTTHEGVYRVQKVTSGYCAVMTESESADPYGYGYGDSAEIATGAAGCPAFVISAMSNSSVTAWTEFTPGDCGDKSLGSYLVTAENEKGVITDYFFNGKGFILDAFEWRIEPDAA